MVGNQLPLQERHRDQTFDKMWKIKGESSREIEGGVGKTDDKGRSGGGNEGEIFSNNNYLL